MTSSPFTITISNPTADQLAAITKILCGVDSTPVGSTGGSSLAPLTTKARRGSSQPVKTVSRDEDEDFGSDAIDEEDLRQTSSDDPAEFDSENEEDEEPRISFDQVKAAINNYGEKKPKDMTAILTAFDIKNVKELKTRQNKWEPVYRKVMAKLKALKRK